MLLTSPCDMGMMFKYCGLLDGQLFMFPCCSCSRSALDQAHRGAPVKNELPPTL